MSSGQATTLSIDRILFKEPIHVGDLVERDDDEALQGGAEVPADHRGQLVRLALAGILGRVRFGSSGGGGAETHPGHDG
mgnify:CR=1 FL=1